MMACILSLNQAMLSAHADVMGGFQNVCYMLGSVSKYAKEMGSTFVLPTPAPSAPQVLQNCLWRVKGSSRIV